VEGFAELTAAGFDGAAVSWVNYEDGLKQFNSDVLPLMIQAGLRVQEPVPTPAQLPGAGTEVTASAVGAGGAG
jgi:FMNH2-dependent dimethyl sulfone monooxygenase